MADPAVAMDTELFSAIKVLLRHSGQNTTRTVDLPALWGTLKESVDSFLATSATRVSPEAVANVDSGTSPLVEEVRKDVAKASTSRKPEPSKAANPSLLRNINKSTPAPRHSSLLQTVPARQGTPQEQAPASTRQETPAERTPASSRESTPRSETVPSSPTSTSGLVTTRITNSEQEPHFTGFPMLQTPKESRITEAIETDTSLASPMASPDSSRSTIPQMSTSVTSENHSGDNTRIEEEEDGTTTDMVDDTTQRKAPNLYDDGNSKSALYTPINGMNAVELLYQCLRDRPSKSNGGYSATAVSLERPGIFVPAIRTLMFRVYRYVAELGDPLTWASLEEMTSETISGHIVDTWTDNMRCLSTLVENLSKNEILINVHLYRQHALIAKETSREAPKGRESHAVKLREQLRHLFSKSFTTVAKSRFKLRLRRLSEIPRRQARPL